MVKATILHCDLPRKNWHAGYMLDYTYKHMQDVGIDYDIIFNGETIPDPIGSDLIDMSEWCNSWHQEVSKKYSVPIVCSTEEGSVYSLKNYLYSNQINIKYMLKRISHFIARSSLTRNMLIKFGISSNKISVIHYGADLETFKPTYKEPEPAFLYVGSINRQKGVHNLLYAYLRIIKKTDWRLKLCVGEWNNDEHLLNDIKKIAAKEPKIEIIPFPSIDKLPEIYHGARCFCMIQDYSSPVQFSNPSVWAMACGLPMISLNTGALKDYIIQGENGFLCNNFQDVSDRMLEITKMDWKQMGRISRITADELHDPIKVADKYKRVYDGVLS